RTTEARVSLTAVGEHRGHRGRGSARAGCGEELRPGLDGDGISLGQNGRQKLRCGAVVSAAERLCGRQWLARRACLGGARPSTAGLLGRALSCTARGDCGGHGGSLTLSRVVQDRLKEPERRTGDDQVGLGDPLPVPPPRDGLCVLAEYARCLLDTDDDREVLLVLWVVALRDTSLVHR